MACIWGRQSLHTSTLQVLMTVSIISVLVRLLRGDGVLLYSV